MKKLKRDNRGFSLVEVIMVVAILSIMAGVLGYSFNLTNGKPAEQCAKRLASAISHGRTATMGKYRNTITVSKDADGNLIVTEDTLVLAKDEEHGISEDVTSQRFSKVGSKDVKVEYRIGTGSYTELANGDSIFLRYDSGSGAMKKTAPGDAYYTGFKISKADKTWYVKLETLTGRVSYSTTDTTSLPPSS